MTPSELSLKVKSEGIAQAAKDLDSLAKAAASVDKETKDFVLTQSRIQASAKESGKSSEAAARGISTQELAMIKAHEAALKMHNTFMRQAATAERLANATDMTTRGITKQELAMLKAHETALKMNAAIDKQAEGISKLSSHGSIWNNTLKSMAVAASAYIGVNFVKGIVEQADAWTMLEAKLKLATGSSANAKVVQQDLFEMAQRLRIPLEDAGKLYTRLADPMRKAGKDSKETLQVVSGLSLALKLGGATAQEASSAMLQFSQAMNSGRLNGGEFNSMAENAPLILKAIEAQLRRTGKWTDMTTESLKKMGSDGKIGVTLIAESVKAMGDEWQKQFDTLPLTVDGAIIRVKNAWFKAMGEMGQETGMGKALSEAIMIVEKMIPTIRDKMVEGFINTMKWIDKNKEGLKEMGNQLAGLIGQVLDLAGSAAETATGFSVVGFTIYSMRLGIAGVVDGVKLITAAFLGMGGIIMTALTAPFKLIFDIAEKLSNYVSETFTSLSTAAKSAGFDDVSKGLKQASLEASNLSANAKSMSKSIADFASYGTDSAMAIVKDFQDGNTEVQKLLNGTDQVSKAIAEKGKYEESTELAKNKRLTKLREQAIANEKAIKAAQKDFEKAEQEKQDAIEKSTTAIQVQIDKLAYLQKTGGDSKYTASQKEAVSLEVQLEKYENKKLSRADALRKSTLLYLITQNAVLQQEEAKVKLLEDSQALEIKAAEDYDKKLQSAQEELEKNKALLNSDEKRIEVLAELSAARQYDIYLSKLKSGATVQEIEKQLELYRVLKENATVVSAKVSNDKANNDMADAKKRLDDLFNTSKVDKFENASTKALKGIVKGFGELNKALGVYGVKQEKIDQARRDNLAVNYDDVLKMASVEKEISDKEVDYKLASYADMAEASKNFFNEGSKGYRALDAVSKAIHAAELARQVASIAPKLAAGAASMFGQSGWGGFAGVAAMGAVMAGLGVSMSSSSSGGMSAANVQKTQGTGTVFGDPEAKSNSLTKSLELLNKSYDKLYPVNVGMLNALKNIERGMTGLANIVLRTSGVTSGSNMGIKEGQLNAKGSPTDIISRVATGITEVLFGPKLGGAIAGFINNLWGKTTQNIVDSGLSFGGSLSSIRQGQGINQYASVDTTKSSWFGLSKKTTNSIQQQSVSKELADQVGLIFNNMATAMEEAAKVLYGKSDDVTKILENLTLSVSSVSLKGLSGQALTDALNSVISKSLDEMAQAAFKDFDKYRQVGEGYAETILRVANSFANTNSILGQINLTLFKTNAAGIDASMSLVELVGGLEDLQSISKSYLDNYFTEEERNQKTLDALTARFKEMNQVLPTSREAFRAMVEGASAAGDTALVANLLKLADAFAQVTKTSEAAATVDKMKPLEDIKATLDKLADSASKWLDVKNKAQSLQDEIQSAMGNPKRDPTVRMQQLWAAMSQDVTAEQKLTLAGELKDLILQKYQVEKDSITRLIDFGKQLRTYVDSLKLGNLSPLTVGQKLAEAQAQYQATLSKAQGGDVEAQGMLQGKADSYLQIAQTALASSSDYVAIFNSVTGSLDSLGIESMSSADKANAIATSSFDELKKLSEFVKDVENTATTYYNESLVKMQAQLDKMTEVASKLGVFEGLQVTLANLPAEIAGSLMLANANSNAKFVEDLYKNIEGRTGSQIDQAGLNYWIDKTFTYGKDLVATNFAIASRENNIPSAPINMVSSEVKALREELVAVVQQMKDENNAGNAALIESIFNSSANNADTVVEGTSDAINSLNYNSKGVELV